MVFEVEPGDIKLLKRSRAKEVRRRCGLAGCLRSQNLSPGDEPDLSMFLGTELVDAVICPTGADGLQFASRSRSTHPKM